MTLDGVKVASVNGNFNYEHMSTFFSKSWTRYVINEILIIDSFNQYLSNNYYMVGTQLGFII